MTFSPGKWTLRPNPRKLKATPIGPGRARTHGTPVVALTPTGVKEKVRRPGTVDCTLYMKIQPYVIPTPSGIDNRWYQEEDLMDPREVASPAPILMLKRTRRVGGHTSLRKNALHALSVRTQPARVMPIGGISWLTTTTFLLPSTAR